LTSNQAVLTGLGYAPAANVDPGLLNPWGISSSPSSPFWVSDNGANQSTLYNTTGVKQGLTVTIPGPPTGQVFNNGGASDFKVGAIRANFIFATEDGTIAARPAGAASATTVATTANAVYKGAITAPAGSSTRPIFFAAEKSTYSTAVSPPLLCRVLSRILPCRRGMRRSTCRL
jgi:hypothetical protein